MVAVMQMKKSQIIYAKAAYCAQYIHYALILQGTDQEKTACIDQLVKLDMIRICLDVGVAY